MNESQSKFYDADGDEYFSVVASYPDLSDYGRPPFGAEVQRVGWIGTDSPPRGVTLSNTVQSFVHRLEQLICKSSARDAQLKADILTGQLRGRYRRCPVCHGIVPLSCACGPVILNGFEVWIPVNKIVYACPGLLTHYVKAHGYIPPREFMEAVERFDIDTSTYDADEHLTNIKMPRDGTYSYFKQYQAALDVKPDDQSI